MSLPIELNISKTTNKEKFNEIANPSPIDGIEKPPLYGIMMINDIPYFYSFPKIKRNKVFRSVFHAHVFSPHKYYCSVLKDYFVFNIDLRKYRSDYVRYNKNYEMFETVIEIRLDDNDTKIGLLDLKNQLTIMSEGIDPKKPDPESDIKKIYKNARNYLNTAASGNSETTSNGGKRSRRRKSNKRLKKSRKNIRSRGRK